MILQKVHFWEPITKSPAVVRIADSTGCERPSRSSKVDDFHLIWKWVCQFLLVIDSNLYPISHRFRDTATLIAWNFPLEIAAKPLQMETWLLLRAYNKSPAPYPTVPSSTPYDLPFSHNTAQWAYNSVLWPFKVIQGQWFACYLKANMRLPISDQ